MFVRTDSAGSSLCAARRVRPPYVMILVQLLFAMSATTAIADGLIFIHNPPPPPLPPPHIRPLPRPPRPNFPLQVTRHRVTVEIDEVVARTRVEETFFNPNPLQLEGTYIFPLPPEAAVSGFTMRIGGREVSGEILERTKAREIYEQIVRQVRDPALLEYVDRGLFRASVFPIPATGAVDISLEYSENLPRERGTATYRYPLDTGKYSAGDYKDVLIDVRLRSSISIRSISCTSHETALVSRPSEREARVSLEAKTLRADKDLVITWNVSEDVLAPVVLAHRASEPEGFFFLTIAPRPEKPQIIPPKDVVFVMDTSGSMLGKKIEQVERALKYCIANLNSGDRFNIIDFATEARRFRDTLVPPTTENRNAANAYVDELKARGGTNIEEGIRFGLVDLQSRERLGMLVLLTDGEPTIGVIAPGEILRTVKEKNPERRRIFVFGVGDDINAKLLDAIARESRGVTQYIRTQENIEAPLANFYDKIDSPVLTDLEISFTSGDVTDFYPRPLPDLFRGEQLNLFGRYGSDGTKTMVLRGKFQGEGRVFEYPLAFQASGANTFMFIPRLWAMRKIGYLLEQMRLVGESAEVKDEVIRLSKRYGVITPYTSYLILEEDRITMRGPGAPPSPLAPVVEWAARDALAGRPGEAGGEREERLQLDAAAKAFEGGSGARSVEMSRSLGALKRGDGTREMAEYLDEKVNAGEQRMKEVEGRTFYLQGNRWVDSSLLEAKGVDEGTARRVKYLSDEYFKLLTDEPGIGKLLSVGTEVTFLWKGKMVIVEA